MHAYMQTIPMVTDTFPVLISLHS